MSVAKTNQKLIEQLRGELDLEAIQSALERGEITPRQAQNLIKWTVTVKDIRENPLFAIKDENSEQYVGEVLTKNRGQSWIGRRYGQKYPHDSAEFTEKNDAVRFVAADGPQPADGELD